MKVTQKSNLEDKIRRDSEIRCLNQCLPYKNVDKIGYVGDQDILDSFLWDKLLAFVANISQFNQGKAIEDRKDNDIDTGILCILVRTKYFHYAKLCQRTLHRCSLNLYTYWARMTCSGFSGPVNCVLLPDGSVTNPR